MNRGVRWSTRAVPRRCCPATAELMLTTLLLVVALGAVVVLLVAGTVALVRRQRRRAVTRAVAAGTLIAAYGLVLVGFGVASSPTALELGQPKCFDEWCGAVVEIRPAGTPQS